jgi:hypothetical protein
VLVVNPGGLASNPLAFPIVSASVGRVSSLVVPPGTSGTATSLPPVAFEPGVAATLTNNGAGTPASTLSVAVYTTNPTTGTIFAAGGFFDVQVTGADASDAVDARFYYPAGLSAAAESGLQLQYWTGTGWSAVVGAGGVAPVKDTADNLDGTISGGRFSVRLDATSTPSILQLGGTVFALAGSAVDTTPPRTRASMSATPSSYGWFNTEVVVTLTATDDGAVARTEFDLDGAGWRRYTGPVTIASEGVHALRVRSVDAAGNVESPQKLVIPIDRTPPTITVVPLPWVLFPANGTLRDVLMVPLVVDSRSGAASFTLRSVEISAGGPGANADIQGWSIGTPDVLGRFRATLGPGGAPRVYTVTYEGVDRAGNRATGTANVPVRP